MKFGESLMNQREITPPSLSLMTSLLKDIYTDRSVFIVVIGTLLGNTTEIIIHAIINQIDRNKPTKCLFLKSVKFEDTGSPQIASASKCVEGASTSMTSPVSR